MTASYSGSNKARQEVGDPGHCERCAEVGHVIAHPNLGCGDVGCDRAHPEEDMTSDEYWDREDADRLADALRAIIDALPGSQLDAARTALDVHDRRRRSQAAA